MNDTLAPSEVSYKHRWRELLHADEKDLRELIRTDDTFETWKPDWRHEVGVAADLRTALDILYGELDHEMATYYLKRGLEQARRAEEVGFPDCMTVDDGLYTRRAEFLSSKAYLIALLHNRTERDLLRQASDDYVMEMAEKNTRSWGGYEQSFFLSAVGMRLICGDVAEARGLFDRANPKQWYHPEGIRWRELCDEILRGQGIAEDLALILEDRFDTIRKPYYQPDASLDVIKFRLETGAILWKYVHNPSATEIDWPSVVAYVSR